MNQEIVFGSGLSLKVADCPCSENNSYCNQSPQNLTVRHDVLRNRSVTHHMQIVSSMVIAQRRMLEIMHKNRHACCSHVYANGDAAIVSRFADIPPGLTPKQQKTFLKFGTL